jgi:hypothetical protein
MVSTAAVRSRSSALFEVGTWSPSIWRAMKSVMILICGFVMVVMVALSAFRRLC